MLPIRPSVCAFCPSAPLPLCPLLVLSRVSIPERPRESEGDHKVVLSKRTGIEAARASILRLVRVPVHVYARGHIGNFRTFVSLDVLRRALRYLEGYGVLQVTNYTDVDDKTINAANAAGVKLLVYYHLLPSPDGFLMRRLFASGVDAVRPDGWTIADDGSLYTLPLGTAEVVRGTIGR